MKIEKIIELYKKYNGNIPYNDYEYPELSLINFRKEVSSIVLIYDEFRLSIFNGIIVMNLLGIAYDISDKDQYFNFSLQYNLPDYEKLKELNSILIQNNIQYIWI